MTREHVYETSVVWTGSSGDGTTSYRAYKRDNEIRGDGKPTIPGSSDPAFRGDPERWNPEELLVASLSQCHMLWFLHVATVDGVIVTGYEDAPIGTMEQDDDGGGRFTQVTLRPTVSVAAPEMAERLAVLHEKAHHLCFIANSVNFPVTVETG